MRHSSFFGGSDFTTTSHFFITIIYLIRRLVVKKKEKENADYRKSQMLLQVLGGQKSIPSLPAVRPAKEKNKSSAFFRAGDLYNTYIYTRRL